MAAKPRHTLRKTLTAAELTKRANKKLANRLVIKVKPEDLLTTSQEKLCLALSYLDATQLSTAKATELMSVIKQLFEITQILQGKPTAIHASNNRKALVDLIPAVLKEATRRGYVAPARVIEGEVVKEPGGEARGTRHTPPGGHGPGPIPPSVQSDFSKILDEL